MVHAGGRAEPREGKRSFTGQRYNGLFIRGGKVIVFPRIARCCVPVETNRSDPDRATVNAEVTHDLLTRIPQVEESVTSTG